MLAHCSGHSKWVFRAVGKFQSPESRSSGRPLWVLRAAASIEAWTPKSRSSGRPLWVLRAAGIHKDPTKILRLAALGAFNSAGIN